MKLHILKVTDRDDSNSDAQYFTIQSLREQVLQEWFDMWGELHYPHEQDYSKEQVAESDNDLFAWMYGWGYDVEVVYIVTEKDLFQTQK